MDTVDWESAALERACYLSKRAHPIRADPVRAVAQSHEYRNKQLDAARLGYNWMRYVDLWDVS
jgi:hypothetical protein